MGILGNAVAASQLDIDASVFIVNFESPLTLLGKVADGTVDAALMPYFQAYSLSEGLFNGQIEISTAPIISDDVRLAVRRSPEGQELMDRFNTALQSIKKDGTYERLLQRWDVPNPQKFTPKLNS